MPDSFVLKGSICYSKNMNKLVTVESGYLVCENGISGGVFETLPEQYAGLPLKDHGDSVIIPGLVDLHIHAPQYAFRGTGMDLELLDWLDQKTFPEEAKYCDLEYADKAYSLFVKDLANGPNTRAVVFATTHVPATALLMEKLEASGLVSYVGKVNMDRNAPQNLCEISAEASAKDTVSWIESCAGKFANTMSILTPRFIPSCSDSLLERLGNIQKLYDLPVQSHLSENRDEVEWVGELCPLAKSYSDAYARFDLFGGGVKTVMAHCVYLTLSEIEQLRQNGVFMAHCPQSNTNLSSGIAPVRKYLDHKLDLIGLGSDIAGGVHASIFRAMSDAIQVSKLYFSMIDQKYAPLTVAEAFYLGTTGGGKFFGNVGGFDKGFEFDAVVIDDTNIQGPERPCLSDRLAKIIYISDDRHIKAKYVRGRKMKT